MPEQLELANVVTLYKKGNVEDPGNYRPISLLQSVYKIYASLIQVRLQHAQKNRSGKRNMDVEQRKAQHNHSS